MDTNNQDNNQNLQQAPQQTPRQTPISKFEADPMQTTLRTGRTAFSFLVMITSFISLFKRFFPKK